MLTYYYDTRPHECFTSPTPDRSIWRYVDLSKFVAMLNDRALFFARADTLGDPFEGSLTPATHAFLDAQLDASARAAWGAHYRENVQRAAISCWYVDEHESQAMWKLYLSGREGVAIRSTFGRLAASFPPYNGEPDARLIYAGLVRYIDYDREVIPAGNVYWPLVHKRRSFEHERELRAISFAFQGTPPLGPGGESVPVDIANLIESVYVAPTSPDWFRGVVRAVVERFGFSFEVHKSRLGEDPIW